MIYLVEQKVGTGREVRSDVFVARSFPANAMDIREIQTLFYQENGRLNFDSSTFQLTQL